MDHEICQPKITQEVLYQMAEFDAKTAWFTCRQVGNSVFFIVKAIKVLIPRELCLG
jgi:hypothetical protein